MKTMTKVEMRCATCGYTVAERRCEVSTECATAKAMLDEGADKECGCGYRGTQCFCCYWPHVEQKPKTSWQKTLLIVVVMWHLWPWAASNIMDHAVADINDRGLKGKQRRQAYAWLVGFLGVATLLWSIYIVALVKFLSL